MENLILQYLYASTFAFANYFVKGFILGDENGLGRTMEVLLIMAQYKNNQNKILVIVPTSTVEI